MAMHTYKKVVAALVFVAFCWVPMREVKAFEPISFLLGTLAICAACAVCAIVGGVVSRVSASFGEDRGRDRARREVVDTRGPGPYVPRAQPLPPEEPEAPPVPGAQPPAPPPAPPVAAGMGGVPPEQAQAAEALLEYTMEAAQSFHGGALNRVLNDVIDKAMVELAKPNVPMEVLNGCLRWAVLLSENQRGIELLHKLIGMDAQPNHCDGYGNTPMAIAIHFCKYKAVVALLAKGAHLKPIGNRIRPLEFARYRFVAARDKPPSDEAFAFEAGHRKILEVINNHVLIYGLEAKPVAQQV